LQPNKKTTLSSSTCHQVFQNLGNRSHSKIRKSSGSKCLRTAANSHCKYIILYPQAQTTEVVPTNPISFAVAGNLENRG